MCIYYSDENNTVNDPVIYSNQIDTIPIEMIDNNKENEIEIKPNMVHINHDAVSLKFDSVINSLIKRNNKTNGIKNLRCFPTCADKHNDRKFCGRSMNATLTIDNNQMQLGSNPKFLIIGEIRPLDGEKNNIWLYPGTEIQYKDLLDQCDPKDSRYFAESTMVDNEGILSYNLEFNSNPKSWQYGFSANRWVSKSLHGFFVTILFQIPIANSVPDNVYNGPIPTTKFVSINQYKSNGFEVMCARVKKENNRAKGKKGTRNNKRKLCDCNSDNSSICSNANHNVSSPQISSVDMFGIYHNNNQLNYHSDSDSNSEIEEDEEPIILNRKYGHQNSLRMLPPKSYKENTSDDSSEYDSSEEVNQRISYKRAKNKIYKNSSTTKVGNLILQPIEKDIIRREEKIATLNDCHNYNPTAIENWDIISLPAHFPISISLKTSNTFSYGDTFSDNGVLSDSSSSPEADNEPFKLKNNAKHRNYSNSRPIEPVDKDDMNQSEMTEDDMKEIENARHHQETRFFKLRLRDNNKHSPTSHYNLPLLNPKTIVQSNKLMNKSPIKKKIKTNKMDDIDRTNPVQLNTIMELDMNELTVNPVDYSLEDLNLPYSPSDLFNSSFSPSEFSPSGFSPNGFSPIESSLFSRYTNSVQRSSRISMSNNDLNSSNNSFSSLNTSDNSHFSISSSSTSTSDEKISNIAENIRRLDEVIDNINITESATTTTDTVSIDHEDENEDEINNDIYLNNININLNFDNNDDNINIDNNDNTRIICKSPTSSTFVAPSPPTNFHHRTCMY